VTGDPTTPPDARVVLASALQGITAALSGSLTAADVAQVVVGPTHDVLSASAAVVYFLTEDGRGLRHAASRGVDGSSERLRHLSLDRGLPLAQAVRKGQPVWIPDHATLVAEFPETATASVPATRLQAVAAVPLKVGQTVLGGLAFSFDHARAWSSADREFLLAIASECAHALERSRLYDQERRARERLAVLAEAGAVLSSMDYETTLHSVVGVALPSLGDFGYFDVVEDDGSVRRIARAYDDSRRQGLLSATRWEPWTQERMNLCALTSGRTSFHPNVDESWVSRAALRPDHREALRALHFESMISVPLRLEGRLLGALTLFYGSSGRRHSRDDLALAEDIAGRAAVALDRVRAHRALEDAVRRRAEADRRKDEFLAMLGHELRNPLAPVLTALELMKLRGDGTAAREREIIERQVRHLGRLVDDLLDVSRITRGKIVLRRQPLEVAGLVARAVEMVSPLLEQRRHRLILDVPRNGLRVDGDEVRLAQVFANLLTNAAKYTDPGGEIRVEARRDAGDVLVACVDDGAGIPSSMMPTIFELFAQGDRPLDRSQGGLGLGLALVRSLVELHGGSVRAHSEGTGRGSRFEVRLPALAGVAVTAALPAGDAPPASRSVVERVLVVDDNPDAAETLAEALRHAGQTVQVAHDGPSALALAAHFQPTTAVLDLGLPVMDGFELGRRLREQAADRPLRLVALTGYGQEKDRSLSHDAGFDVHLVKPVELGILLASVARPDTRP
jgi:signal transduction histidine kinase